MHALAKNVNEPLEQLQQKAGQSLIAESILHASPGEPASPPLGDAGH
jgi:hypothetical protein